MGTRRCGRSDTNGHFGMQHKLAQYLGLGYYAMVRIYGYDLMAHLGRNVGIRWECVMAIAHVNTKLGDGNYILHGPRRYTAKEQFHVNNQATIFPASPSFEHAKLMSISFIHPFPFLL
jgi:hypothetical protein